jgi:hypothetical protein
MQERRTSGADRPNGYHPGSYRIATAPEPKSSRLVARLPGLHHELVFESTEDGIDQQGYPA